MAPCFIFLSFLSHATFLLDNATSPRSVLKKIVLFLKNTSQSQCMSQFELAHHKPLSDILPLCIVTEAYPTFLSTGHIYTEKIITLKLKPTITISLSHLTLCTMHFQLEISSHYLLHFPTMLDLEYPILIVHGQFLVSVGGFLTHFRAQLNYPQ